MATTALGWSGRYALSRKESGGTVLWYTGLNWSVSVADAWRYADAETATAAARSLQRIVRSYVTVEVLS